MGCNCGRKKNGAAAEAQAALVAREIHPLDPTEWGPILWKILHCFAEHLGSSGSPNIDADQAVAMETLIGLLPVVIPCQECQQHAAEYLRDVPLPPLRGLGGDTLRRAVRAWLYAFHQAVRARKGQDTQLVPTVDACAEMYRGCTVAKCEYTAFIQSVAAAVRQGWVRMPDWRRWYAACEKMRVMSGGIVVG